MRILSDEVQRLADSLKNMDSGSGEAKLLSDAAFAIRTAEMLTGLFEWLEDESGEITPHVDKTFPDFNETMTALRNALVEK